MITVNLMSIQVKNNSWISSTFQSTVALPPNLELPGNEVPGPLVYSSPLKHASLCRSCVRPRTSSLMQCYDKQVYLQEYTQAVLRKRRRQVADRSPSPCPPLTHAGFWADQEKIKRKQASTFRASTPRFSSPAPSQVKSHRRTASVVKKLSFDSISDFDSKIGRTPIRVMNNN